MTRDEVIDLLAYRLAPGGVAMVICHDGFDYFVRTVADVVPPDTDVDVASAAVLLAWTAFRAGWDGS